jgi:hypothetical protein
MKQRDAIKVFEDKKVRTLWDEEQEKWYFTLPLVFLFFTNDTNSRDYYSSR